MVALILLFFLCAGVSGSPAQTRLSSFSGEYGGDGGDYFDQSSNQLDGPMTALKIRANDRYLLSIQVRYGDSWSITEGSTMGSPTGMELYHGEGFVQVLGRFGSYVEYLAFRTNLGRVFAFGSSSGSGISFEAEPMFPNTVLRFISGRSGSSVNALGFHWDEDQWIETGNQSSLSTQPSTIIST
ncbi:zymogen granule membrane protein 16-like isoform X1 [Sceloporus undulatus]|uniref:zymogen granule membrane protein 16-like isoform X1 n=1 Tax=Sceloporus undulatus TaxID=8520 RepID=UPI001C4DD497|nr:zymogen granule membrane protein 16-like isoform X1 [Sceloporus undulatus]XP_042327677.1 zymogen granule membrane protein 16-like isoform X1 [Sceloporus undulatus]